MKLQVFIVRDAAANCFGNPLFLQTAGVAIRSIGNEINKGTEPSALRDHPEDFELFHLGEFETDTARFSLLPDPVSIALCKNLKVNGSV